MNNQLLRFSTRGRN